MIHKILQTISSRLRAMTAGLVMAALITLTDIPSASSAVRDQPHLMHPINILAAKETGQWSPRSSKPKRGR